MEKKLQRNEQDKMLAGVCAGLAEYFDVDVTWIRIAFVVATLAGFSGVLAYIILWIAVPAKPFIPGAYNSHQSRYSADYRVYEESKEPSAYNTYTVPEPPVPARKAGNGRMIAGLVLVAFGAFFLLDEFNVIPYWFDFDKLWPLIFIIPGILIISKNGRRPSFNEGADIHPTDGTTAGASNAGNTSSSSTSAITTTSAGPADSTGTSGTETGHEETKL
ncbi:PspC domain-containing protein [Flavihumibacter sp. R14]|nr:PspC domain-containing protein [Flavihumibacter soli]